MSDSYQAIYDAVRSRISNGDIGSAVGDAARNAFDFSGIERIAVVAIQDVSSELTRPSVLFKPVLSLDGNAWCALLGEDLQVGLAAFGDSPASAMRAFDEAWTRKQVA